jgi:hypothetical protein
VDWINLLQKISLTIHNKVEDNMIYYDKSIIANSWLGFDRADLKTIEEKEKSLDTKLPPSYKEFLLTTNGFKQISLFSGDLYPVELIDWTKKKDPDFLEIFNEHDDITICEEDYFIYGDDQRSENFKVSFLNETLQISEWVDGSVILLNPMVKFGEEWEAWIYANWFPGARRYQSFSELIEREFYSSLKLIEEGSGGNSEEQT